LPSPIMQVLQYTPRNDRSGTSSGEKLVFCGCLDGSISVYHLETLELILRFPCHGDAVTCMKVYQPPGEALLVLITGGKDKLTKLSVAFSGANVGVLDGFHTDAIWSVDMFLQHNVEPWVITGSLDGTIGVWGMLDKKIIRSIQSNGGAIMNVQLFAAPDVLKKMQEDLDEMERFELDQEISIIAACEDRNIRIWSMQTGQLLITCETVGGAITDLITLVPAGWRLHAIAKGAAIFEKLYQIRTGKSLKKFKEELKKKENKKKRRPTFNEKRDTQWEKIADAQDDDVTLAMREALVLASSTDGNIYVHLARTGLRLRVLVDLKYDIDGGLKQSPIYSMQLFVPPVFKKGRAKSTRLTRPSELDLDAMNSDTINPLLLRKGKGLFHNVKEISLKDVTTLANKAGELATNLISDADQSERAALIKEYNAAIVRLQNECIVVASKKDGSMCSWNITTGLMMNQYFGVHDGATTAIPSFCALNYDDLKWPEKEDIEAQEKIDSRKMVMNEDGEMVDEEEDIGADGVPGGDLTLEKIARKNESAASSIQAAAAILDQNEKLSINEHPILVTGGIDGKLRITVMPNIAEYTLRAYYSDLKAKVPKEIHVSVPRAFEKFPRMYLLSQQLGGANNLFSGKLFQLFALALKEHNSAFLRAFLPLAKTGFILNARECCVGHEAMALELKKRKFYLNFEDPDLGLKQLICIYLKQYVCTRNFCNLAYRYAKSVIFKQDTDSNTAFADMLGDRSLILMAIKSEDLTAIRIVLTMWLKTMMLPPADLQDQTTGAHMLLTRFEIKELATYYPLDYSYLLSKLTPVKSHPAMQALCNYSIPRTQSAVRFGSEGKIMHDVYLWRDFSPNRGANEQLTCFYLPLRDPFDLQMLQLTIDACNKLNSVHLFNSECLITVISYGWSAMGRDTHYFAFMLYLLNLVLWWFYLSSSVYPSDARLLHNSIWDNSPILQPLQATVSKLLQLSLYAYSVGAILGIIWSVKNSGEGLLHYFITNPWGGLELVEQILVFRIATMHESGIKKNVTPDMAAYYAPEFIYNVTPWLERSLISIASLLFFVRFLYFFRALESTGKLVAILFEIGKRMRVYIFIIFVAMLTFGYSIFVLQAGFPLYRRMSTTVDDDGDDVVGNPKHQGDGINDFGSLKRSAVYAFGFGFDFDSSIFSNTNPNLTRWSILLGCATALFVSIILFNLLIAFISNVYTEMAKRGTSQWRFMQGKCFLVSANAMF